jgi:rhodanese-related sulfurtransferase
MSKLLAVVAVLVVSTAMIQAADTVEAPKISEAKAVADISHADLTQAIKDKKVVLIDCNSAEQFAKGHIPGAINLAAAEKELATKLPAAKDALVVAYCGSEKCPAYKKGAEAAVKLGFTNVKHYAGGLAGWTKSGEKLEVVEAAPKAEK